MFVSVPSCVRDDIVFLKAEINVLEWFIEVIVLIPFHKDTVNYPRILSLHEITY